MKDLQIFNNKDFGEIRVLSIENEPWLVGKDVAERLGYSNTRDAISKHVDDEDKANVAIHDGSQNRKMVTINESGLYSLVLSSKLPTAKKFKRWVTSEVLPSIRKNGAYMTDEVIEKTLTDPDFLIGLATELKKEKQKAKELELTTKKQEQIIGELKPSADYTDRILKSRGVVPIKSIAKDYGMSAQEMNKKLHEMKIQYKQGNQWLLYSKYHSKGYTHSETIPITRSDGRPDVNMITKWTQKGRLFLYEELKAIGYVPMIEQN